MTRDGYHYLSAITIYGIFIMIGLVYILAGILSIVIDPSDEKLILLFLTIVLFGAIVITYAWYRKISFTPQKLEDYSLKK